MAKRAFEYAGCPADYPGDTLWWTLRFVGDAPHEPPSAALAARLDLAWPEHGRSEWVNPDALVIGDHVFGGRIVGFTEVGGAKAFKVDLGRNATRIVPLPSLQERVERRVQTAPSRNVQLEYQGHRVIDDARLLGYLDRVHAEFPLVAVVFQEGQFLAGRSLVDLDDATLVRTIRASRPSSQ
ncbi:hypothetical protein [Pendulispora albinea]|uniref:Uncharacterized protein n=1 Tax=Pendulispora albinea TaxID=2741071 RepID=A0ABZ2LQF3_9BACT